MVLGPDLAVNIDDKKILLLLLFFSGSFFLSCPNLS